jgi:hypothetical protein
MATFVLIEPDAFNRGFNELAEDTIASRSLTRQGIQGGMYHNVRRPVRGIQIKDDTYATIQVRNAAGVALPLFDAAAAGDSGKGIINSNFLIQQISEQRIEKQQIVITFGEPYIFFFGEQPRMLNVTGVLLNTDDFNWRAEWWANYERSLRGTACVRSRSRVYLSWDDIIVEGYLVSASSQEDAESRNFVQFQFQMFVTNYQNISSIGDPNAHFLDRDINIDPSKIELPGGRDYVSRIEGVRSSNVTSITLQEGRASNSLLEFLRDNQVAATVGRLASISGQVVDVLQLAGQFVSGRRVRVPYGYQGSAAFDAEVQFALASVPGASQIMNGPAGALSPRKLAIKAFGAKLVEEFAVTLGSRFMRYAEGAGPGKPLSANTDEFVARIQPDPSSVSVLNDLYDEQLEQDLSSGQQVKKVFEAYGIEVEPDDELTQTLLTAHFGIASISSIKNVLKGVVGGSEAIVSSIEGIL